MAILGGSLYIAQNQKLNQLLEQFTLLEDFIHYQGYGLIEADNLKIKKSRIRIKAKCKWIKIETSAVYLF